ARAAESAVNGGDGAPGTLWVDGRALEPREPAGPDGVLPEVAASSFRAGFEPGRAVDASPTTQWKSEGGPDPQWLVLDFGRNREFGGLIVDWDSEDFAV